MIKIILRSWTFEQKIAVAHLKLSWWRALGFLCTATLAHGFSVLLLQPNSLLPWLSAMICESYYHYNNIILQSWRFHISGTRTVVREFLIYMFYMGLNLQHLLNSGRSSIPSILMLIFWQPLWRNLHMLLIQRQD